MHRAGILGLAHSDHDLIVFLEAAGMRDPETAIDDPAWWRGAGAGPASGTRPECTVGLYSVVSSALRTRMAVVPGRISRSVPRSVTRAVCQIHQETVCGCVAGIMPHWTP